MIIAEMVRVYRVVEVLDCTTQDRLFIHGLYVIFDRLCGTGKRNPKIGSPYIRHIARQFSLLFP